MFKRNKKEEIKNINDFQSIEDFIKNSKELFKELIPFQNNQKSALKQHIIFNYLSNIQFGIYIIPYLSLKDILSLRLTCKEINLLINSNICCLNYYLKTLKNQISYNERLNLGQKKKKFSSQLKPFHELNDESEFLEQKNILNKIKNYMKSPEFSLEILVKTYRVEMDYLKYEENHQERYMNSLIETQKKINKEYESIIGNNKKREESWVNISKEEYKEKNDNSIDNSLKELTDEELKKKIQELKIKRENIVFKINKEKKTNEDLTSKNEQKKKIINNLKKLSQNNKENKQNNDNENEDLDIVNKFLKNE
jgi:hypothetical protein